MGKNKNSWGENRTRNLTGMSRTLLPIELPSHFLKSLFSCQFIPALLGMSRALSPTELPSQVYSKIIQLSTGSVASSAALTNYKTCSLRSRELPSQVFSKIIQLSTGSVASSGALTNYKICSLRSRELPRSRFYTSFVMCPTKFYICRSRRLLSSHKQN